MRHILTALALCAVVLLIAAIFRKLPAYTEFNGRLLKKEGAPGLWQRISQMAEKLGIAPNISATPVGQTDVMDVKAQSGNPKEAAKIANAYADAYVQFKQKQNVDAARESGFELASPMALAVTARRLLSLKVTAPVGMGIGMKVQELVSAVPVSEVDSIEVKRLAMGKTVTVTVRGVPFVLEVGAGADAKGVADALERVKAAA